MPDEVKKTKDGIIAILGLTITIIGVLYIIFSKQPAFEPNITVNTNEDIAVTPDIDKPQPPDLGGGETLLTTGNLLESRGDYIPSPEVYTSNYDKESIKLALNGKFKVAQLEVEGQVLGEGRHFISFSFDNISGVLNAVRKDENQLDLAETKKIGGIFVKDVPIKFVVDLKNRITLATTKEEFEKDRNPTRDVILWDQIKLQPPTVVRFLFAPFNEYGQYGGVKITSIKFNYLCEDNSECSAKYCGISEKYTQCLQESFGHEAAVDWCQRAALKECENFQ
ncbi:MAG: hypothetical protein HUU49_03305 [Candidatus Buchananbacteria bacterium]|nr:hypothetical protein [Candidatus Buchananbacteria bacterium]